MAALLLLVYGALIAGASLAGGWLPHVVRLTHQRMQLLVSGVGGLMLGVAILHLFPHGAASLGSVDIAVQWMLGGVLLMFFLLRVFHFHHHPDEEELAHWETSATASSPLPVLTSPAKEAGHDCQHDHPHGHAHGHAHAHQHGHQHSKEFPTSPWAWAGIFIGLSLHTLIDGMALAASVQAESTGHAGHTSRLLAGLATFLAIALHKPLDAMAITSLMAVGGWSPAARSRANLAFAMICPLGVLLFYFGLTQFLTDSTGVVGRALALAAGVFLCIALSDLLPEIEFHSHDRLGLSATLLGGVGVAAALGFLEPAHVHGPTLEHHHGSGPAQGSPADTHHEHDDHASATAAHGSHPEHESDAQGHSAHTHE